jgi:hypothetical protein
MPGRQCFHCKQWIEESEAHDCWTTTEGALTADLPEDLRDAWERLRESAVELGDQRIYASHSSIMFSRRSCYFFVRPKRQYLEVCVFLGRPLEGPQVRRAMSSSKTKFANLLRIVHRDEVESPITDWLREAYEFVESQGANARSAQKARSPRGASHASSAAKVGKPTKKDAKRAKAVVKKKPARA